MTTVGNFMACQKFVLLTPFNTVELFKKMGVSKASKEINKALSRF